MPGLRQILRQVLSQDGLVIDVRLQQLFSDRSVRVPPQCESGVELCDLEEQLAGKRISVRMEAHRRQTDQAIAMPNRFTIEDLRAINDAHNESGDVVLAVCIEARHLRRFSADERNPASLHPRATPSTTETTTSGSSRPVAK